ncbi:hypothetical protein BAE44_0004941 [Dichanthelium oligosanthes]|uniref:DUF1618 domain-containing protein n=1 Tax=Dichanthelium oligosanthes TaxID=888268 RepID=A0A1E5W9G5_9POAL|nr:hypothetical protein BAE44_0004941 [Dichanthelium oligosanthes]
MEPQVLATDENLVLLRVVVSPEKNIIKGNDLYVYKPAGDGGPSLTLLPQPPGGIIFCSYQVGVLSCPANNSRDEKEKSFFMVAALCHDESAIARGRFVLHLYYSKHQTWTATKKCQDDQGYCLLHQNTRVVAVGGEDATIAFVDLWQGILLCDLSQVEAKPCLRYAPLPPPAGPPILGDARLSRDIAFVEGRFKYVQQQLHWLQVCSVDQTSVC